MGYPFKADNSNPSGLASVCETCNQTALNTNVITFA
ncbi:hypothetical protein BV325_02533 [Pseudomonas syringae pv. actinidiae]|nr:hypothetical protein BV325_02533 [Pseudomonas syringae pv. actinidiae]